jgi:hypothetical protein
MMMLRHVPGLGLGGACQTDATPTFFPFLNSTRPPLPSSAVSRYTIVDRDLLPSPKPKQCSLLSRSQVPPLSSDFSHPLPDVSTNHTSHATAKRHQSHHPIPSQIPRSPPIFHKGSCFVFPSPHLTSKLSTHLVFSLLASLSSLPPLRALRTQTVAHPCARDTANHHRPLTCHAFSVRYTDTSDRFKPGLPDSSLIPMHMLKCFRASRDALFVLSRRRTSSLFGPAALTSIAVSTPIWQLSASMHSSPPIRPTY